jgi:hypothetical protein
MFGDHGHWSERQRAKRRGQAGEHDVTDNYVGFDCNKRNNGVSISAYLRDELSLVRALESLLDDNGNSRFIVLLFSPNNHVIDHCSGSDCLQVSLKTPTSPAPGERPRGR